MTQPTDEERQRWMLVRAEYHERLPAQIRRLMVILAEKRPPAAGPSPTQAVAPSGLPSGGDG